MTPTMRIETAVYDLWCTVYDLFSSQYFRILPSFDFNIDKSTINSVLNLLFWTFFANSFGYSCFRRFFMVFLKSTKIKFHKHIPIARSIWTIAFHSASVVFLMLYHKYMILPALIANTDRLFPIYDNIIFFKSRACDNFHLYTLFVMTHILHSAVLDYREKDNCEATTKIIYSSALIALLVNSYENYFVVLSINVSFFNIFTECILLTTMQLSNKKLYIHQLFFALRIISWSYFFVNLLPFRYLVPTLFSKNFKLFLNIFLWFWYGMSIWNSPVLQYFYHQIYHIQNIDCAGNGSAARCILSKDTFELRHGKKLRKAYLDIKLYYSKTVHPATSNNAPVRVFQTLKCVMALKRKLKRIRVRRGSPCDNEDMSD